MFTYSKPPEATSTVFDPSTNLLLTQSGVLRIIKMILYTKEAHEMTAAKILASAFCLVTLTFVLLFPAHAGELRAKAGAYYFDGWTGAYPYHITKRLTNEFFDREPVWGWRDDSLEIVEQQIDYAADNGLSFFAFDWYYPEGPEKKSPLNTGLELYRQAKNKNRLEFCLLAVNHGGFFIRPPDWEAVTDIWAELFKDPMYLKVNGKPLLILFGPNELVGNFGGHEKMREAFDRLREKARTAGQEGVSIAACAAPGARDNSEDHQRLAASGYDILTGYNYHRYLTDGKTRIQSFEWLIKGHELAWSIFAEKAVLPYMPVVTTGWDRRPWEDPNKPETHEFYYPDRTHVQVADFVGKAVQWLDDNSDKTPEERLILLYAWNENGEGGYLTPTKSQGDIYLKAIGEVLKKK